MPLPAPVIDTKPVCKALRLSDTTARCLCGLFPGCVSGHVESGVCVVRTLDEITERTADEPAPERSHPGRAARRDARCDHVGVTFGGGSITVIAIRSCRIEPGRARAAALMRDVR